MKRQPICYIFCLLLTFLPCYVYSQLPTKVASLSIIDRSDSIASSFRSTSLIFPTLGVAYGALSVAVPRINWGLPTTNRHTPSRATRWIDGSVQFVPVMLGVGLNIAGVKGRHSTFEQGLLVSSSLLVATLLSEGLKHSIYEQRPDKSDNKSFPSGHTLRAFAMAECLRLEYGRQAPWLVGVGYASAIATATLRITHHRHWLGDVVAGAGLGIASTQMVYGIYHLWQKKQRKPLPLVLPYYDISQEGVTAVWTF